MTTPPLDLLRELPLGQGQPDPAHERALWRAALIKGSLLGTAIVLASVVLTAALFVRQQQLSAELDRLALVEAEVQATSTRLTKARGQLKEVKELNGALVAGLVNARSGSALMRDLQRRVPVGVQITALEVPPGGGSLSLKGVAADPLAFARINSLQIELGRSPLLAAGSVRLRKALRAAADPAAKAAASAGGVGGGVSFELSAGFRPSLAPAAELRLLQELGATGMALRLQQLQAEGLLP